LIPLKLSNKTSVIVKNRQLKLNYYNKFPKLNIIKQVTWNKSSLLLKIDLQNTQTLQLN